MKPKEDIKTMSNRFTIIINWLKSYGKTYLNEEVVRKMLKSLPKSLKAKVTAIEEAQNLETLSLDQLIGSLLTHEMRLKEGVEEEKVEKKKISVALKSTIIKESESSDKNKEMTMFPKRFKRFMKSNKKTRFQRKEGLKLESTKEKDPIICYKCKKPRHIKFNCPQWKKKESSKQKHKANVVSWSDEDSSNEEEQEVANFCLMAIEDSKVTCNSSSSIPYCFNELQDTYDELGLEFEVMISKYRENISK
ncbi:hypothetical protein J1N35_007869 [Gossypium stocksii]|uniref:CCHC-type domain-containing protein n=1 Tax=Gossypium stocksii TaxID=47602 RepID=A0A9D3W824_9ROSI|nr:hypothetical protein J1N35_007869 [Gossypium stocksii]